MMIGLPLVILGGLLGSSHCIGMCGGIALLVNGRNSSKAVGLMRQSVFTMGRLFTYGVMGCVAGALSGRFQVLSGDWLNVRGVLAMVTGIILILQGLTTWGVLVWPRTAVGSFGCQFGGGLRSFLQMPGWIGPFIAGLFTAMIPCGLVYGFVTLAASTGDLLNGGVLMLAFGLGTAPAMVLTGWGSALLRSQARATLLKVAAGCVVLTGAWSLVYGVNSLRAAEGAPAAQCPFCVFDSTTDE